MHERGCPPAPSLPEPLPPPPSDDKLVDFTEVRSTIESIVSRDAAAVPHAKHTGEFAAQFVHLAIQCASTFRATDYLGGCNGARIRFSPDRDWPENKATGEILDILQEVKSIHPSISWSDLIVLSGTVALEAASGGSDEVSRNINFCGGRTDAPHESGSPPFLAQRAISDPILAANDDAMVRGLGLRSYVALLGLPRSRIAQLKLGLSGTWSHPSELNVSSLALTNDYFIRLLSLQWEAVVNDQGVREHVAVLGGKGKARHVFMTERDLAVKADPVMHSIVVEYASDLDLYLLEATSAWNDLMMADRFESPCKRACEWR